jgi:DnaJ-class molecular chaperone
MTEKKRHMCPNCDGSGMIISDEDIMINVCPICRGDGKLTTDELTAYDHVSFAEIDENEERNKEEK